MQRGLEVFQSPALEAMVLCGFFGTILIDYRVTYRGLDKSTLRVSFNVSQKAYKLCWINFQHIDILSNFI